MIVVNINTLNLKYLIFYCRGKTVLIFNTGRTLGPYQECIDEISIKVHHNQFYTFQFKICDMFQA